jgi:malonyl-CoA O-methyltransferase
MHAETLRTIRTRFNRAATSYDAAAVLQREVAARLDERLDLMRIHPQRILDLGSGTGDAAALLRRRFGRAARIALDLAPAMLHQEHTQRSLTQRWLGPRRDFICGDMHTLTLRDACVDMVWSSLALQWASDPLTVFGECRRVLRPEGLLLFSSFGPDTLLELRHAFARIDTAPHTNRFVDMHDLGDALLATGFAAPVMETERIVLTYADLKAVLQDLKSIGANTVVEGRHTGLMGRARWQALQAAYATFAHADGRLPATFEVVYGHAWAGTPQIPKHPQGESVIRWQSRAANPR